MAKHRGPDVILVGFGTSDALQITVEAQQAAVRAGRVLALDLPIRLRRMLERQGVDVRDLADLFDGRAYAEAYAAVANTVLATAEQKPPSVFLSQGSPLFMNSITRYLVAEAKRRELNVKTYPGVSPIDAIVADLGIDIGLAGLQTISARGFAAKPQRASTTMPLLLLEVAGLVGTGASAEAYGPLAAALKNQYPESQPMTLLNMPGNGQISRATVTVERFPELIPHIDTTSSLFVDVVRRPGGNT